MSSKLFIPILLGTVRKQSASRNVANWLVSEVSKREDIETFLIDPSEMDLPMDDERDDFKNTNPQYRDSIVRADGLIIVSPEYNHSFPGSLKRVLDILYDDYYHKAVGLVGVSKGNFGGSRVIESLIPVVKALGLSPTKSDLSFPNARERIDDEGNLLDQTYIERTKKFLDELLWMAEVLKWGRNNL